MIALNLLMNRIIPNINNKIKSYKIKMSGFPFKINNKKTKSKKMNLKM